MINTFTNASACRWSAACRGGPQVPDASVGQGSREGARDVGAAVVGHHPSHRYPVGLEERERSLQEGGCRLTVLIGELLGVGEA